MSASTIFYQECPVCGRSLRIPAKYFGRLMSCSHCEGEFRAGKEQLSEAAATENSNPGAPLGKLLPAVLANSQLGEV